MWVRTSRISFRSCCRSVTTTWKKPRWASCTSTRSTRYRASPTTRRLHVTSLARGCNRHYSSLLKVPSLQFHPRVVVNIPSRSSCKWIRRTYSSSAVERLPVSTRLSVIVPRRAESVSRQPSAARITRRVSDRHCVTSSQKIWCAMV